MCFEPICAALRLVGECAFHEQYLAAVVVTGILYTRIVVAEGRPWGE